MPINSSELLSVVAQLTEDRHVRATVRESLKGGCIAATTTVVGGLLLGPAGLAVGLSYSWVAYCFCKSCKYICRNLF